MTCYPPHPPELLGRVGRIALLVSHGAWRAPDSFRFKHCIENEKQLVHRSDERHFGWLTGRAQALIKRPQHWIPPDRSKRARVQDPAQPLTAALDLALPAQGAAVAIERRHARQRRDLASVPPA